MIMLSPSKAQIARIAVALKAEWEEQIDVPFPLNEREVRGLAIAAIKAVDLTRLMLRLSVLHAALGAIEVIARGGPVEQRTLNTIARNARNAMALVENTVDGHIEPEEDKV